MTLEKLIIEENPNEKKIRRNRMFFTLGRILKNDYFRIKEKYNDRIPCPVGEEFGELTGALITLNCGVEKNCSKKKNYEEQRNIFDSNLVGYLTKILHGDRGRVIEDDKIIMDAIISGYDLKAERKYDKEMNELLKDYIDGAEKIDDVGTRTTNALAIALVTKKPTFTLSKTVLNRTGTGKVTEYSGNGIIRELYLENKRDIAKEDCIDPENKVYMVLREYVFDEKEKMVKKDKRYLVTKNALVELGNKLLQV